MKKKYFINGLITSNVKLYGTEGLRIGNVVPLIALVCTVIFPNMYHKVCIVG